MLGTRSLGGIVYGAASSAASSGLKLYLSGIDRTGLLQKDSFRFRDSLNSRASLTFNMVDKTASYLPIVGEPVIAEYNGTRIFKGSIENPGWTSGWTSGRFMNITCVNMARVLDRRLVAKAYLSTTTDDIIRDIITTYLHADGIVAGTLDPGPLITKVVYNYMSAAQVMDEICDLTGYSWTVDQFGLLHVRNRESNNAAWNISDGSAPVFNLQIKSSRATYSNIQWLRAGQGQTSERIDSFKGDGQRQTFTAKFPLASAPVVKVNTVAKTVGIRGVDGGKDWYWNKGEKEVTQDDGASALTTSDTLTVDYVGFYPIMVKIQSNFEIVARQAIEGGTGMYERIDADESLEDRDLASSKATGLLRKYSAIAGTVTYGTYTFGLEVGQLQTIQRTEDQILGDYLISEISFSYSVDRGSWVMQVTALSGEQVGDWRTFFKKLFRSGAKFTIRENEVIYNPTPHSEQVNLSDVVNFTDPIGDGSADPFTTAWVSDLTQSVQKQFRVGKARLGRDYFS